VRPAQFADIHGDFNLYEKKLAAMQRFRGRVYVSEGNLTSRDLTDDGRHFQAADYRSWHLLTVDERGSVSACGRLAIHESDTRFSELLVSHSALARAERWGNSLRQAVEAELRSARETGRKFAELGGLAVARELRCSTETVRMVLSGYALGEIVGGVRAISTVNVRHHCSSILRRIGGRPFKTGGAEMPSFYEPQYRSELEILRFDSSRPNPRYQSYIEQCRVALRNVQVIAAEPVRAIKPAVFAWNMLLQRSDIPRPQYSPAFL
jgi:predicted GNAT family N-acyltransferase